MHRVLLSLSITPVNSTDKLLGDLKEVLEQRKHLDSPKVWWDEGKKLIFIEVGFDVPDRIIAERHLNEEIAEVASAVIEDFDTYKVNVVKTDQLVTP